MLSLPILISLLLRSESKARVSDIADDNSAGADGVEDTITQLFDASDTEVAASATACIHCCCL